MSALEMGHIRLMESRIRYSPVDLPESPPSTVKSLAVPLHIRVSPKARGRIERDIQLIVDANYRLEGRRVQESTSRPDLLIDASFELLYLLPDDLRPSPLEIKAFCQTNAMLNSWPYWREYVQSTVARMNLSPLTLPLFRVTPPGVPSKE